MRTPTGASASRCTSSGIVKRRKGLIEKLLAALRAKMKSNTALKAGLDGLRHVQGHVRDEPPQAAGANRQA